MIPNQWYAVLESHEVKPGQVLGVRRLGEQLVLWRDATGRVSCIPDQCPHRGAAFSAGRVVDGRVECPFHGFQFDSAGSCCLVPANGKNTPPPKALQVHPFPTAEAHDFIWVWWGEPRNVLPPLPYFEDLADGFSYVTDRATWPVHYSRAIENQLDVIHLPFVHATTIGRGGKTLVDGPYSTLENDELDIWVSNRADNGLPARRKSELLQPDRPPSLRFRFPNLWMNRIGEDFRIVVSFTCATTSASTVFLDCAG
jgi:phenylpropionate dioxygenase-like ring-hydroxylating dioxygenase large terminal subunit